MDINDAAGKRIRLLRRTLGISQSELAQRVNMSYQQLQKYETGKNRISIDTLEKISDALEVSSVTILKEAKKETKRDDDLLTSNLGSADYILLKYLPQIKDAKIKKYFIALAQSIAEFSEKQSSDIEH